MRYRLPHDCAGVTHAGVALDRAADGTIEAEEDAAAALAPHGIIPAKSAEVPRSGSSRARADDRRMLR